MRDNFYDSIIEKDSEKTLIKGCSNMLVAARG
jgi:hypothetical protein